MEVISIINYKGGVGKTTTTANLGAELAWRGYKVLMLDTDPQASLTFSFISPEVWEKDFAEYKTIKKWFDTFIETENLISLDNFIFEPSIINNTLKNKGKLSLIPSHLGLLNVDLELASELGGQTDRQINRNYFKVHELIAKGLQEIEYDDYDFVLIDCPPSFNIVTKNSIIASNHILVPAKPDYLSTLGIDYLIRNVNSLVKEFNSKYGSNKINPKILGILFTMVQTYSGQPIVSARQYINQMSKSFTTFDSYIKENKTIFSDAPSDGVPVIINRYSNSTHQEVVRGLEEFVDEFLNKVFFD